MDNNIEMCDVLQDKCETLTMKLESTPNSPNYPENASDIVKNHEENETFYTKEKYSKNATNGINDMNNSIFIENKSFFKRGPGRPPAKRKTFQSPEKGISENDSQIKKFRPSALSSAEIDEVVKNFNLRNFSKNGELLENDNKIGEFSKSEKASMAYHISLRKHFSQYDKNRINKEANKVFVQDVACTELDNKIMRCMECRRDAKSQSQYCRFFAFRKLKFNEELNRIKVVGFCDINDVESEDISLWKSTHPIMKPHLDKRSACYILSKIGPSFLKIANTEYEALYLVEKSRVIFWKRPMFHIRELCDICSTTIFNLNWVCGKCGFCICPDCFLFKMKNNVNDEKHLKKWQCSSKANIPHEVDQFLTTQVIPGNSLWDLVDSYKMLMSKKFIKNYNLEVIKTLSDEIESIVVNPKPILQVETKLFHMVRYDWIDNNRLLRILDHKSPNATELFRVFWAKGMPVIVSNCHYFNRSDLWHPKRFTEEVGAKLATLVNCRTHEIIEEQKISDFWDGFECEEERLIDTRTNERLILKLKDWPPTEDFAKFLPEHFNDLMNALPFHNYTQRNGIYNLTTRLPDFFVKPDLGPKMYNAYGSAKYPSEATTNLHLDVSDATNLMLYVGIVKDDIIDDHHDVVIQALKKEGVCQKQLARAQIEIPGALWHIYDASDTEKIREFLRELAIENNSKIESDHDPIHDQSSYLDVNMRRKLKEKYDIDGYCIVQYLGDAVFIPGGAPHQVRNLHSCIKAAEDFVSPEHLNHSLRLTNEFRQLSDTHSNKEDKLQVKNITFHSVKDAIAVLNS